MFATLLLIFAFIAIAVALAWFLIAHDHGQEEPIGALWLALGAGVLATLMASFLESRLVHANSLQPIARTSAMAGAAIGVGMIEEVCKFVPLAFFLWRKKYFNEHTDGIIYFALAGLGFGLPENILYTLQYGSQAGFGRIIMTPFFHAAATALVGYALVRLKLAGKSGLLIIPALIGMASVHALYDLGLSSGKPLLASLSVVITFGLSTALFVCFARATELDQDRGLSAVGHNKFCRSCGTPNPYRHLYCTQCGQNA